MRPKGYEKNIHQSSEQNEFQLCEIWEIQMASSEKELIFHKGSQKEREMLCIPVLKLRHPLVRGENPLSSSGWHSNVVLLLEIIMSFLCTGFSWAFPSYMLKYDFSLIRWWAKMIQLPRKHYSHHDVTFDPTRY
jgi:hypothetical protein